ncbi:MAG: hypothetical protein RIC19_03840 [Phaeodactylibacter sp.]|uniref:hypothetical protein n=1 Tax=Phaeodactylibacter sp. TaxID=1940289 RepID=UPI0032EC8C04
MIFPTLSFLLHFWLWVPPVGTDCPIVEVKLMQRAFCKDQNTLDWTDDQFTGTIEVTFTDYPATGLLRVEGEYVLQPVEIDVAALSGGSHTFEKVPIQATRRETWLSLAASFSAIENCRYRNRRAGRTREQCSVCPGPAGTTGGPYPGCWPSEEAEGACNQSVNYAPDPDHPELTPVRYMQTIVHIFQKEDPDSLGQWVRHPDDPGNFTEEHMDIIQSWFDDPKGPNGVLSNLCDDPTDGSPHMTDARIRLLNTGTAGKDVFFHPDNKGWGIGYSGCKSGGYGYWYQVDDRYLKSPDPSHPDYEALIAPQVQHAFHVFITGGKWMAEPPGDPRIPDDNDCYWPCGGGLTSSMGCQRGQVPDYPAQALFGVYNIWQHGITPGQQTCEVDYPGSEAGLGEGMLGEIFHVLSVDHLSPLQAHKKHADGGDGCADTPWKSDYNRLGCNFQERCALTECQIGKMHHFFAALEPDFERFPDGDGGFALDPVRCRPTAEGLVIPPGADIVWEAPRELYSDLVISAGARLTVLCDLALPAGAAIEVENGGELIIESGKLYTACPDGPIQALQVAGRVVLEPGSVIKSIRQIKIESTGSMEASNTTFVNCGLPEGMFCGQNGSICE